MSAARNTELVEIMAIGAYTAWRRGAGEWARAKSATQEAFRNEQRAAIEAAEAAGAVIHAPELVST